MQGVAKYASSCCGASPTAYVINTTVGGKTFSLTGDNGKEMNIPLTVLEVYNVSTPGSLRTLPTLSLTLTLSLISVLLGPGPLVSNRYRWDGVGWENRGTTRARICQPPSPQPASKAAQRHSTAKPGTMSRPTAKAQLGAARNAASQSRGTITAPLRRARRPIIRWCTAIPRHSQLRRAPEASRAPRPGSAHPPAEDNTGP
jgi:hypothetical protein